MTRSRGAGARAFVRADTSASGSLRSPRPNCSIFHSILDEYEHRGRPPCRARTRGAVRAAHDALRPRLPAPAPARAVLVPQASTRVRARAGGRQVPRPLPPRHARADHDVPERASARTRGDGRARRLDRRSSSKARSTRSSRRRRIRASSTTTSSIATPTSSSASTTAATGSSAPPLGGRAGEPSRSTRRDRRDSASARRVARARCPGDRRRQRPPRPLSGDPRAERLAARRPTRASCEPADRTAIGRVLRVDPRLCTGTVREPREAADRPTTGVAWLAGNGERGMTMRKLLRRPSPAMVVACLALLVALGGTGMAAATQVARNSVGTPQLKDSAVSNPKIRTTRSTPRRSRRARFSARTSRPASSPQARSVRRALPDPPGPAGAAGPAGVIGAITDRTASAVGRRRDRRDRCLRTARGSRRSCGGNERAISGGTDWSADAAGLELMTGELEPAQERTGPGHRVPRRRAEQRADGTDSTFTVYALCYTAVALS